MPPVTERTCSPEPPCQDSRCIDVSIVVPIFNEEENVEELVQRVSKALLPTSRIFELIVDDDGSSDTSGEVLVQLATGRPWLRPVRLVRNYGQSSALQAGVDRVRGRDVVTLDGDLQNGPLDIPTMLDRLDSDAGTDVISGWREHRQDKVLSRRLPSCVANALISRVTGVRLHDYGCALKVYRREIIDRIRPYSELHRFIPSLARDAGARIAEMPVRHHARARGVSKYGIDWTFRVILDLVLFMRYRQRPLHAFGGLGLWFATPGVAILFWLGLLKLFGEHIAERPLLTVGVLLVLVGVQLVVAGLVGELLSRIYHDGRSGAQYHVRELHR